MLETSKSYVASTLRKDFQVSFCYLHTQHPSWLYNRRINKVKGRLGFPLKTKSPSGATAGGIPPPKKWSHFLQNFIANVLSMPRPKLWVNLRGTRVAKGRRSANRG
jgi:hypothetical protein